MSNAHFSADGQRVVTASFDNTARIWDAASGKPIGEPLTHEDTVINAQFSADGRHVVTVSHDHTARIWDAASGKPIGEPLTHEDSVINAQFSADGRHVVTVSHDHTARIWDAASGKPIGEPLTHEDSVINAQFSADGRRVVTASRDHTARIWINPAPAWDDPEWLKASVDYRTGRTYDEDRQFVRSLTKEELDELQQLLKRDYNGELCAAPTWEQIDLWIDEERPGWEPMKRELGL
jgi:WD40 repeat protein